jgi:hypothetical protein
MKANEIRITIQALPEKVFEFTVEPKNTKQWVDGIGEETVNTQQIGLGTIYTNHFGSLEVTDYERNKFFELTNKENSYCCSYSYRKLEDEATELTYFEYMQDGSELEEPMKHENFKQLQKILEK